jgi:hypothetical protein
MATAHFAYRFVGGATLHRLAQRQQRRNAEVNGFYNFYILHAISPGTIVFLFQVLI